MLKPWHRSSRLAFLFWFLRGQDFSGGIQSSSPRKKSQKKFWCNSAGSMRRHFRGRNAYRVSVLVVVTYQRSLARWHGCTHLPVVNSQRSQLNGNGPPGANMHCKMWPTVICMEACVSHETRAISYATHAYSLVLGNTAVLDDHVVHTQVPFVTQRHRPRLAVSAFN